MPTLPYGWLPCKWLAGSSIYKWSNAYHSKGAIVIGTESKLYEPYVKLVNEILVQCRQARLPHLGERPDLDMICVCNDPEVIFGTRAITYRKPDLVYINWSGIRHEDKQAECREEARSWAERSLGDKTPLHLDWGQVLNIDGR